MEVGLGRGWGWEGGGRAGGRKGKTVGGRGGRKVEGRKGGMKGGKQRMGEGEGGAGEVELEKQNPCLMVAFYFLETPLLPWPEPFK